MVNVNKTRVGVVSNPSTSRSLPHWVREQVDLPKARVRSRLRGNNLHLLFECDPCPEAAIVMANLRTALTHQALAYFLPAGSPQVYRVVAYGRTTTQTSPQWTESFELHELVPVETDLSEVSSLEGRSLEGHLSKIVRSASTPTEPIPAGSIPDELPAESSSNPKFELSELALHEETQTDLAPLGRDAQVSASQVLTPPRHLQRL